MDGPNFEPSPATVRVTICLIAATEMDRLAYRLLLTQQVGLRADWREANLTPVSIWQALRLRPQMAIVVSDAATTEVRDALKMIPRLSRGTRILAISTGDDPLALQNWGACPLDGFVAKSAPPSEIGQAVSALLNGRNHYSSGVRDALNGGPERGPLKLSSREAELLPLLARGLSLREAAAQMSIGYKTADSYRTSMLRKLGLRDRVGLVRYAIREGIIDA